MSSPDPGGNWGFSPPPTDGSWFLVLRKRIWLILLQLFLVLYLEEEGSEGGDVQVTAWATFFVLSSDSLLPCLWDCLRFNLWYPPISSLFSFPTELFPSNYSFHIFHFPSSFLDIEAELHSQITPIVNLGVIMIFPFHSPSWCSIFFFFCNWYLWPFSLGHMHTRMYMFDWMAELGERKLAISIFFIFCMWQVSVSSCSWLNRNIWFGARKTWFYFSTSHQLIG